MELYGLNRQRAMREPLVRAVVEIRHRRLQFVRQRVGVHRVTMIVRGYDHGAGTELHHRLIPSPVPVRQFIRSCAARDGEELVAEANAEERFASDELT